ncbi:hypothetical protein [Peribacillus frigoritolerans]|uniref:Uncharacterized protein n=1 Tax=Peribacillus castrilensis TaxID=2897690 RepID=A0AAW9NHK4_9BACI|nr:hypothetical protein [Peribacillus castrilensis]
MSKTTTKKKAKYVSVIMDKLLIVEREISKERQKQDPNFKKIKHMETEKDSLMKKLVSLAGDIGERVYDYV